MKKTSQSITTQPSMTITYGYQTLDTFIQELVETYDLLHDNATYRAVERLCRRTLKTLDFWRHAKTKGFGKHKEKVFSAYERQCLFKAIEPKIKRRSAIYHTQYQPLEFQTQTLAPPIFALTYVKAKENEVKPQTPNSL